RCSGSALLAEQVAAIARAKRTTSSAGSWVSLSRTPAATSISQRRLHAAGRATNIARRASLVSRTARAAHGSGAAVCGSQGAHIAPVVGSGLCRTYLADRLDRPSGVWFGLLFETLGARQSAPVGMGS